MVSKKSKKVVVNPQMKRQRWSSKLVGKIGLKMRAIETTKHFPLHIFRPNDKQSSGKFGRIFVVDGLSKTQPK